MSKRINNEIEKLIISDYNLNLPISLIMKNYKLGRLTIIQVLNQNKIPKRQRLLNRIYNINENVFEKIDTEEKAYWLGFLFADGYNSINDNSFSISLQEKDGYILERLVKLIFPTGDYKCKTYFYKKIIEFKQKDGSSNFYNCSPKIAFQASSKKMCEDLSSLGMVPKKTKILDWPKIDLNEDLTRAFIKGFMDGDGWISRTNKTNAYELGFICNYPFGPKLKEKLLEFGFDLKLTELKTFSFPMNRLTYSGNRKCQKFLDWLYKDSTIHLDRKYQKYLDLKKTNLEKDLGLGTKGYCYDKARNKFLVRITKDRKVLFSARFRTEEEARKVFLEKRKEFFL